MARPVAPTNPMTFPWLTRRPAAMPLAKPDRWPYSVVMPLLSAGVDTLVLGCTHYPFLTPLIQELTGPEVTILDPSPAVARHLRHRLVIGGLLADHSAVGGERYFTSGALEPTAGVMARLLTESVILEALPERFRSAEAFPAPSLSSLQNDPVAGIQ